MKRLRHQHFRGGHGELGITLKELEGMIDFVRQAGYPDDTRICSAIQRDKGLVDIFFVEHVPGAEAQDPSVVGGGDTSGVV